jgi:hypothetical protein
MRELVVSAERKLDGNAKGLNRHDGYTADSTTYREVDHWVLFAVSGRDAVDHDKGKDGDE